MKTLKVIAGLAVSAFALTNMFGGGSSSDWVARAERKVAAGKMSMRDYRRGARERGYTPATKSQIIEQWGSNR